MVLVVKPRGGIMMVLMLLIIRPLNLIGCKIAEAMIHESHRGNPTLCISGMVLANQQ